MIIDTGAVLAMFWCDPNEAPVFRNFTAGLVFVVAALISTALCSPAAAATGQHVCTNHEVLNGGTLDDVLVPPGFTCTLNHVNVGTTAENVVPGDNFGSGTPGTELNVVHSTVTETVNPVGGIVNVVDSALTSGADSVFGSASSMTITHSSVAGDVGGDFGDVDAEVGGADSVTVKQSTVAGAMRLGGARRAMLDDSNFGGDSLPYVGVRLLNYATVVVRRSTFSTGIGLEGTVQAELCDVRAGGLYVFDTPANGRIILGGSATATCADPTVVVNGPLQVQGNASTTPVDLRHVYVHGDLICDGNAVAPRLEGVTVTGKRTGQCAT